MKKKITRASVDAAYKTISQIIIPAVSLDDAMPILIIVVILYMNHFIVAMKTKEKDPDEHTTTKTQQN